MPYIYNISHFLEQLPAQYDEEADVALSIIIDAFAQDKRAIHTVDRPVSAATQAADPTLKAFYSTNNYVTASRIGMFGAPPLDIEVQIYDDVLSQAHDRGYKATAESLEKYLAQSLEAQKSWANRLEKAVATPSTGNVSRR